jgi:uncharacterized protein (TIGR03067 family)
MRPFFVGVVVAAFTTGTVTHLPDQMPAEGLDGKWEITSQQYDGGLAYACPDSSMTFSAGKMSWVVKGKNRGTYNCTTDAKTKPRQMDLLALDEPFKGQTFQAIFEVDGDTLRINMGGFPVVKRPTDFGSETEKGPRHWGFSLKRVKP